MRAFAQAATDRENVEFVLGHDAPEMDLLMGCALAHAAATE
jgi:hypothetical protein